MIVPQLKGGLCNQLFQIATAYAHAKRLSTEFGINYNLKHGCLQGHPPTTYRDTLYKDIPTTDYTPTNTYNEPHFRYTQLPNKKDLLINGYFQTENYFSDHKDGVKSLFTFPDNITKRIDKQLPKLNKKTVGVHVRRGDYKLNPDIHTLQPVSFYKEAMNLFDNHVFILCSDDIQSVVDDFGNLDGYIYCNSNDELEDLYMLSQCDSNIICNSAFSWWGSWLGKEKDKVICPDKWFGPRGPQDYQDVFVEGWIKL
jgi:hypothetical protein